MLLYGLGHTFGSSFFLFIAFVCAFQLSLVSSCTPRTRTTGFGAISLPLFRIRAFRLKLLLWVKCVRAIYDNIFLLGNVFKVMLLYLYLFK
jgi:hypothetical protein